MTTDNMNNNYSKRTTAFAVVAGILLVLGTAGCNGSGPNKEVSHGESFATDDTPKSVDKFVNVQIASGARTDATLNAYHFDGVQLNSLGREKLRAMLKDDDACEPLTVYLNLKGTGEVTPRREAVTAFLLDEGLLESQVQLKEGANPASTTPAAKALKALAAADAGGAPGAPPSAGAAAPAAGASK